MRILGIMVLGVILAAESLAAGVIEEGSTVLIEYTLIVEGEEVDTNIGEEPLEYVYGRKDIIPGLARALEGLSVGDERTVIIQPEDAYGEFDEKAVQKVPKLSFPDGYLLQKGMVIELLGPNEEKIPAVVWDIDDEHIELNFNHPLAGKVLEFSVKIIDIK